MGASEDHTQSSDMEMDIDSLTAGLARILLNKGDTYAAPARTERVELQESWSWGTSHGIDSTRYLDASCLLFGRDREFLEVIDFDRRMSSSKVGAPGAVSHSGDMLRTTHCEGTHSILVNLALLSPAVVELFITMSSYCGRLKEILRPAVRLKDAFSGECLCEYQLEEQAHEERERCSSVVMCRVFRQASGPRRGARTGHWEVEAVGHMGQGDANDYTPMLLYIQQTHRMADCLANWTM